MARPFAAGPSIPVDRVQALRNAFMAVTKDAEFVAAANKQQLEVDPVSGQKIQEIVARISQTPKPVIRELRDIALGPEASAAMDKQ
jgi:tripartite-type tricarboxylate transporter receptor subunit TctC